MRLRYLFGLAFSVLFLAMAASGQTETNGSTPGGLTRGAPAGSYALSGFDNVNLYNGHQNFRLPLLGVSGRGNAGYQMTLPVEQTWTIFKQKNEITGVVSYYPEPNWWTGIKPGYGAGALQGRKGGTGSLYCGQNSPWYRYSKTLTRLTFTAGDGTEFELRDQLTGGEPRSPVNCTTGFNRGKVFFTADGSAATFISDADIIDSVVVQEDTGTVSPSGYLLLRDGTRYRILNGTIDWMRDRNGNKISFLYDSFRRVTNITDSLGRQITISYAPLYSAGSDVISYNGFGGTARTISVNYDFLQNALRSDQILQTLPQLFPDTNHNNTNPYNPIVIKSVTLPNGQQYQLLYNSYGEVARALLPTGAAIEYDYAAGLSDGAASGSFGGGAQGKHVYRRIIERRTYPTGDSGAFYESKMTYSRPETQTPTNLGYVVTEQCTSSGTLGVCGATPALLAKQKHYFYGSPRSSFYQDAVSYGSWQEGREYRTEEYDTNGTTVLRLAEYTFAQRAAVAWWTLDPLGAPPNDPRLTITKTTIEPIGANLVSQRTAINPQNPNIVGFDQYNNQTDLWESDFGLGAPGAILRHTHTDYLTTNSANGLAYDTLNPSATNSNLAVTFHLRSLPVANRVYSVNPANGVETLAAQGTMSYDESGYAAPPYGSVTGWLDPGTARGNATTSGKWLDTTGAYLLTHAQYDQCGNVCKVWDARDTGLTNPSQITYSDAFSDGVPRNTYAFATSITTAVPDPSGIYGSSVAFTTTSVYDFNTGKVFSTTDPNAKTTSYDYSDPLDRLKQVTMPDSGRVRYNYFDAPGDLYVQVLKDEDSSRSIEDRTYFDGLGRPTRSFLLDGTPSMLWLVTDTYYDNMGRVSQVSNPYRVSSPAASVPPTCSICTTSAYDALGRVKSVTTPDSAQVTSSYGALTSGSLVGTTVLVTDQTGKSRRSLTDSLGRLARVDEPDVNGNLGDVSSPMQPTTYSYDVLGNLRLVTQGVQQRFFTYDSLSRLLRARNPELAVNANLPALTDPITGNGQWSNSYAYDNNGNLTARVDARNVTTTYAYDALNRNITVDYSDTTGINPDITRLYDSATNGKGRLRQSYAGGNETVGANVEHTNIESYDVLGRPTDQRQRFKSNSVWSANFQTQRTYDLAGHVKTQSYPSGRTVTYNYDLAGRLGDKDAQNLAFTGNLGDGTLRTYASEMIYSPLGGMTSETFGTDTALYNKTIYNSRGQAAEIRVGTYHPTDSTWWNRGAIINHYSDGCWGSCGGSNSTTQMTDNNGNLKKQDVYIPNSDVPNTQPITSFTTWWQQYNYDALNRLDWVREISNGVEIWKQDFAYDRYGNRTIDQTNTWGPAAGPAINKKNFTVDTSNNRLGVPAGQSGTMSYDNAGNLTTDTYSGAAVTRAYDAENRMTSETQSNGYVAGSYSYNADGQRVRRTAGGQPLAVTTWQVYGIGGELLAEYAANAPSTTPQKEYGYRNGQLLITVEAPTRTNVGVSSAGAIATAQNYTSDSTYPGQHFRPSDANDGVRFTTAIGDHYWRDEHGLPSWLQIDFSGSKTIDEIDVYTMADNYATQADPSATQTFSSYGTTAYDVQYWTGSAWQTVTGGSVSGNNLVWKKFNFTAVTTSKMRVVANAAVDGVARIVEVEAWGVPAASTRANAAVSSAGATATAQNYTPDSAYPGSHFQPAYANDGVRFTTTIGDHYWRDEHGLPSWLQIDFNGSKTIDEIDVYTMADNYAIQADPSSTQTFSNYGTTAYDVQYWTGSAWATVSGGSITGNNLVWKKLNFTAVTTSKIRVVANAAVDGVARIVEVEAWTVASTGASANLNWLVTDQLGTPRMIFDKTGSLAATKRHDYLPFGEEIFAGTGARSTAQGYSVADGVRQKFTQKERDIETGLDYSIARYYSSMQGRFTGTDPYVIIFEMKRGRDAEEGLEMLLEYLSQPQNWAKYSYGLNNPLKHTDPTGMRSPTKNEQAALNRLDQLAAQEGDTELGNGLRAARAEIAKIIDGLGNGQQDVGINVAVYAILNIGNTHFSEQGSVTIGTANGGITIAFGPSMSNKCNVFVAGAFADGAGLNFVNNGASSRGYPLVGGKPPAANWLGDSRDKKKLTNLGIVTDGSLRPGDIVAWRNKDAPRSGHSSTYIGGNVLVYAGGPPDGSPKAQTLNYVNRSMTGGFANTGIGSTHEPYVVRRYNGKP
ncbi:MAG TPA: RHS repeat-associated core domain-containing protein [Pyrinomonadaceae bacterium]|nr:RHS repeat-associated core domain-containing protein [Pyrinomonadaceae bacterium]